jgi:hypothetical protein
MQDLISENSRLRDALKETKRDRCQIELAKKILNVSENQCAVRYWNINMNSF